MAYRALLVDYAGVMTEDTLATTRDFCRRIGLPPDTIIQETGVDGRLYQLACDVEIGAMPTQDFERAAAAVLGLGDGDGFLADLYSGLAVDDRMVDVVRRTRGAGVRTALVSNSWGAEMYAVDRLEGAFDELVISGEVGLRKPDPQIYTLAAGRVGAEPGDCVLVDDLGQNLKPARAMGMHTILHRDVDATIAELERLFALA